MAFLLAFCLACPGVLLETGTFLRDLRFEAVHVQNVDDPTFRDTGNGFVYHVTHTLSAGLGWPLLLVALASVVYALVRRERGDGLLAAFALPYYVLISLAAVRYARYDIPLLPILALWIGRIVADGTRQRFPLMRVLSLAGGALVAVAALAATVRLILPMAAADPRDRALAWLQANAPASASVAFPTMPWFQTAPLSPYFSFYQRGGWRGLTSPEILARVVYNGKDWDVDALNTQKPDMVVLSEYDYADPQRLGDPVVTAYVQALRQDYRLVWSSDLHYKDQGPLPTQGLPHDMLYTNPYVIVYQRKGP